MMYVPALLLSTVLGYLCVNRLRATNHLAGPIVWFLAVSLGLGLAGIITFLVHLFIGWHAGWAPGLVAVVAIALLIIFTPRIHLQPIDARRHVAEVVLLAVIGIFMVAEGMYYPMGGWDAWSCWNLKAKFIYLGRESWTNMLDPLLWRSNTQYPLLLPSINVWFWDMLGNAAPWSPMLNSALFSVLTAGTLLFGMEKMGSVPYFSGCSTGWGKNRALTPIFVTAAVFLLPFSVTLGASQYSDIVVGLFLVSALVCLLADEFVLCGIFLGLLAFTKTEGTVAAGVLAVAVCITHRQALRSFLPAFAIAALPAVFFTLLMAPPNEAFINGLASAKKPSTWERLQAVLAYLVMEIVSLKWNGIWILLLASIAVGWKKAFGGKLQVFALFFAGYIAVLLAYYQINTFFEIIWWLNNTLNRILFAILPAFALWAGLSLKKDA